MTDRVDTPDVDISQEDIHKAMDKLLDAQDRHLDNPEWYQACLVTAFSKTSDADDAILIADTMYDIGQPEIDTSDEEQDQKELLKQIEDAISEIPNTFSDESEASFSVDEHGMKHAPAGSPEGGQFIGKSSSNTGGNRDTTKSKKGKTHEKGSIISATKSAVSGAVKGFQAGLSSKPIYVGKKEHELVIKKALSKAKINPPPSERDIEEAKVGIDKLGAWGYRRNLVGNTTDRRSRRNKLLKDFGDGETCPCIYCGIVVTHGTLEQDKIYTTEEGGRYKYSNVVPSCGDCNKRRGDMSFEEAIEKVKAYSGQIREK